MDVAEICPLTREGVAELLSQRQHDNDPSSRNCKRRTPRWAFPSTVELWLPTEGSGERHTLATSINLSTHGIGIRCDEPLEPGLELGIAVHEPEVSFHGRAQVRHCTDTGRGFFIAGLEFVFDDPSG